MPNDPTPSGSSVSLPQLPSQPPRRRSSEDVDPFEVPEGRVLSTLNPDGSRRWLTPRVSVGRFWRWRRAVGWVLILVFAALPWLRMNGKPPILLDVMTRKFVFFGTVFRPTDTLLLALLFISIFIAIFLATAFFGRVWCGWACPQTVYMEFVYRPIERLFLGKGYSNPKAAVAPWRRILMYLAFFLVSAHLANTFLAYFVGTDRLVSWTFGSPTEHWTAFSVFAVTTGLMMFDFCFYREQLCTLVCPYGRMQSVLLDRDSLIVGYDAKRGEPRTRPRRPKPGDPAPAPTIDADRTADCVDCTLCVQTCPTGIDIRDGLQLECIHCAQCIDACDAVMEKLDRPRGLIRYSSQNRLERTLRVGLRYRVFIYPLILVIALSAFVTMLVIRKDSMVVQLRAQGNPYTVVEGGPDAGPNGSTVKNTVRLRIDNRAETPRIYRVEGANGTVLQAPAEVTVDGSSSTEADVIVLSKASDFTRGRRLVTLRVTDGKTYDETSEFSIIGPFGSVNAPAANAAGEKK